jgi:hypothetical protein
MEPEANYPVLEAMVSRAYVALTDATLSPKRATAPGPFEVAGITYLSARIQLRQSVNMNTGGS